MSQRIIHIITGLDVGGAEMALYSLLSGLGECERPHHRVISLIALGPVADKIKALGVQVDSLNMPKGRPTLSGFLRLLGLLRSEPRCLLQGWMYHGNLIASFAALCRLHPRRLLWCIHNSLAQIEGEKPLTRLIIRFSALLSRLPQKIIYVAQRSARQHEAIGYAKSRTLVIPNGYDVTLFKPDASAPARLRSALGVADEIKLIGLVGRWDWSKDHANFISALSQVPGAHGVLIGKNVDADNAELMELIKTHGVQKRVHLLGYRSDVAALMPGLDLLCLSSRTEAMPNVVGEAMSCAVPCVVTDVGDAAEMVGESGWVCPSQNAAALAATLSEALKSDLAAQGQRARARLEARYTQEKMVEGFRQTYKNNAA